MNLYKCFIGNVTVESYYDIRYNIFDHSVYCGLHSYVVNYPLHNNVKIKINTIAAVQYNVSFTFTIMDRYLLHSFEELASKGTKGFKTLLILNLQFSRCRYQILIIHVLKTKFIKIKIYNLPSSRISAFDGPGLLSKQVQTVKNHKMISFFTKTFQCTFIIKCWFFSSYKITYSGINNNMVSRIIVNNNTTSYITYPDDMCHLQSVVCLVNISVKNDDNVNLTLARIETTEEQTNLCQYAGITVLNTDTTHYRELKTVCHYFEGYRYQRFYSKKPFLLFIIYMYKEYVKMKISMYYSQSKCTPITINVCSFEIPCKYSEDKLCSQLQHMHNFRSNCIGMSRECIDGGNMFADIVINNGSCVVAQLNHDLNELNDSWSYYKRGLGEHHICRIKGLKAVANSTLRYNRYYSGAGVLTGLLFDSFGYARWSLNRGFTKFTCQI